MIGMIRPLVQEAPKPRDRFIPFIFYIPGVFLSSTIVGMFLGVLGSTILPSHWLGVVLFVVVLIGVGMACCDLGIAGARTPTLHRQTCRLWWHTINPQGAIFLWGCDLGLGWTTIRVASLYWIVCLVVFTLASPWIGAVIMGCYGLALVINLGIGTSGIKDAEERAAVRVVRLAMPLQKGLAVVLLLWCVLIVFAIYKGV